MLANPHLANGLPISYNISNISTLDINSNY